MPISCIKCTQLLRCMCTQMEGYFTLNMSPAALCKPRTLNHVWHPCLLQQSRVLSI
jgi:hypothetical protein